VNVRHRLSFNSSPARAQMLAEVGIDVAREGFVTIVVHENDATWDQVRRLMPRLDPVDMVDTVFAKRELAAAEWLELVPTWHCGYPQPDEDNFGYRTATYDLSEYCDRCGVGLRQRTPFQMKGEPRWGRNGILQLNWVFGEFFTTPEVYRTVFAHHGVSSRPVLNRLGSILDTVVQLAVEETVPVATDALEPTNCTVCGRTKFTPVVRGYFPATLHPPSGALFRTQQYFGSRASAHQMVVASQAVVQELTTRGIRGASYHPLNKGGA